MGRINPLIIILHQFPLLETKLLYIKFHCVIVGRLNVQHDFIDARKGRRGGGGGGGIVVVLLGFVVFEDGGNELRSNAVIAIGGEDSECHNVDAMSSGTIWNSLNPRTYSTHRKSIPIGKLAQIFILFLGHIIVEGSVVRYRKACLIYFF